MFIASAPDPLLVKMTVKSSIFSTLSGSMSVKGTPILSLGSEMGFRFDLGLHLVRGRF